MNNKQKIAIVIGLILVVLMGLFPPWKTTMLGIEVSLGYHLIFAPMGVKEQLGPSNVDALRLLVQWIGVCIVIGGVVLILKD